MHMFVFQGQTQLGGAGWMGRRW